MLELLWLIPALPFAAFILLALAGSRLPRAQAALLGVGAVGASAVVACVVAAEFLSEAPTAGSSGARVFRQTLWSWIETGGLNATIGFYLDAVSLTMVLVVTVVGFLIHLYAAEFMEDDEGFTRFFAYTNLFIGSMLVLVLAALCACSSNLQPVTRPLPAGYEKLGHAQGKACGAIVGGPTAYNFIPILLNSRGERAYQKALASVPGATALIDVTMQEDWYWLVAFSMRCVTCTGEAIR